MFQCHFFTFLGETEVQALSLTMDPRLCFILKMVVEEPFSVTRELKIQGQTSSFDQIKIHTCISTTFAQKSVHLLVIRQM